MASEIADYLKVLAQARSSTSPAEGWKAVRTLVDALFLRRYDKEYLEEMKGIADGASTARATVEADWKSDHIWLVGRPSASAATGLASKSPGSPRRGCRPG